MGQTAEELRSDIEQRRQSMSGTMDAIEDRVLPGRIIERRKRAARGWLNDARERVMGSSGPVEGAGNRVVEAASRVEHAAEMVTDAPHQLAEQTRGAPLLAGGVAFGMGALLAVVIPETAPERRAGEALAPKLSPATEAVKTAGQDAVGAAKEAAEDAAGELKRSATDHVEEVAREAKDAGAQLREAAQEQQRAVREGESG